MNNDYKTVRRILAGKLGHVHFVGICGVGMAGLAFHLKHKGWRVSGCDLQDHALSAWLTAAGIEVRRGHAPGHLAGVDWVVRTTAVRPDHPELQAAAARGLPVFQRGIVLAAFLSGFTSIIVSGTHGKTTTTAMLTQILRQAGRDPSFCIGGVGLAATEARRPPKECKTTLIEEWRAAGSAAGKLDGVADTSAVAGAGRGDCLVVEADESDGTLAYYEPDIAVVTNIEFDHAEHFTDLTALRACFAAMLRQVRRGIVYCADDPEALALCRGLPRTVSYGLASTAESSAPADWRAAAIEETAEDISFQVWHGTEKLGVIRLSAPGRHNVLNALAACAAASICGRHTGCGVGFDVMRLGLQAFQPVRRRFERVIANDDVLVISDYAHHPTEIAATLRTLPCLQRKRWLAVFQPHRFSRTRALARDFAAVFTGLDELVITPVYAASEPMLTGGTSWDLYEQVRRLNKVRTFCAASLAQAWGYVRAALRPGDGLLIIGAGDVEQLADWARAELAERGLAALDPASRVDQTSLVDPVSRVDQTSLVDPACAWFAALEHMQWKSATLNRQVSLADKTTLRVGGIADIFIELADEDDLTKLLRWTHANRVPVTLLGAGSNVLVSDLGVRGVVVRLVGRADRQIRVEKVMPQSRGAERFLPFPTRLSACHSRERGNPVIARKELDSRLHGNDRTELDSHWSLPCALTRGGNDSIKARNPPVTAPLLRVVVGAGVSLHELTSRLEAEGLAGLEFLTGIPGTVGGALRMNAGAWGEAIGSRVAWVRFLNPDGSGQVAESASLGFDYRHCAGLAGKVVLEAAFNVSPSNQQAVRARMDDILKRRAWLHDWRTRCSGPSAGSVFRNPEGAFAGRLLEQAGMKGRQIGGARVLEAHANVIVTEPFALASDVRALMEIMRQAVRERSGIELTEEIVCLE